MAAPFSEPREWEECPACQGSRPGVVILRGTTYKTLSRRARFAFSRLVAAGMDVRMA
jgi:hypothetical protein